MVRARKPKSQTRRPIAGFFLDSDLIADLHIKALGAGRLLIEEIEFRLKRDLEREALGPRRSIPIRKRTRHADG